MRFVHEQDEVGQSGQIVEVAFTDVFRQPFDPRRFTAANFRVDLGDIEDVHLATDELVEKRARPRLVVVTGDDLWRVRREFGNALENIFRCASRKVGNQFVVNRQVRRWR